MGRRRVLFEETYIRPGLKIKAECLPSVPSAAPGFEVEDAYILRAGRVMESDGREREYQELRVYFKEQP